VIINLVADFFCRVIESFSQCPMARMIGGKKPQNSEQKHRNNNQQDFGVGQFHFTLLICRVVHRFTGMLYITACAFNGIAGCKTQACGRER
jgi:hypothetical protein